MKKILFIFLMVISINVNALELVSQARNAILIEPSTQTILFEKNIHDKVAIASLTKMMGLIIIFEKIDSNQIKYSDIVKVSKNAASMGGSQIWLSENEEMSVEDIIKGIVMASANDGIVAMAEYIAGTEEKFVKLMNEKAKEMGLLNTFFVNSSGLDEEGHYSSAYDVALIAIELMKHPDIFKFTTLYEDYLRKDTDNKFWLVNTNKLIKTYMGADGLKTGMTDNAGYSMAVTAKRDGMRLLAVVLGEKEGKVRNKETAELLDYGFNSYKIITLKQKGEVVGSIEIDKASPSKIEAIVDSDIVVLQKKNETIKEYNSDVKLFDIKLPIKKGDVIGNLLIKDNRKVIKKVNIISNNDMKKQNFFHLWFNLIKSVFTGNLI